MKKEFPEIYVVCTMMQVNQYRDYCDASFGFGNYYSFWSDANIAYKFIFFNEADLVAFKIRFEL